MSTICRNLRSRNGAGQIGCGRLGRTCLLARLMLVLGLGGAGCDSIYQKTQAPLPPEPCAQLKFRIEEAQRAEQLTGQGFTTLRDGLNQGRSDATIATDIDRVAAAVFEFERRVASVRDAAANCEGQTQLTSEIERLQGRSEEMLDRVQVMRRGGNSTTIRQLDEILQRAAKP